MSGFEERVRALFQSDDARTVFRDGIEYVEVAVPDLRAAMDPDNPGPSKDDAIVDNIEAIFGAALPTHIAANERRQRAAAAADDSEEVLRLGRQLDLMRRAEEQRQEKLRQAAQS